MARTTITEDVKHNLITSGTKIKGDISADGDLRIDGVIEGTLNCKGKLVLGPEGSIKGDIVCKTAEVMGNIEGTMQISELLSIKSTAKINGEIKTTRLAIEPNAIFTGTCDMGKSSTPVQPVMTKEKDNNAKK